MGASRPKPSIALTPSGINVTVMGARGEHQIHEIEGAHISTAIAYKRDCWAVDLICLAIGGPDKAVEVTEEMKGWEELLDRAPSYLPGWRNKDDWYQTEMLP